MRSALAPYRDKCIHVTARFSGLSKVGYAVLEDVETPGGRIPYAWVTWPGRLPMPGDRVRFEATVRQYFAETRQEFDFGLKDLRCGP